ncbi:hypothetical protein D3C87_200550 [compost metagenome]
MKIFHLSMLVFLAVAISSCKKENKKPSDPNLDANSFFLMQNNSAFIAKKMIVSGGTNEHFQISARSIPNKPYDKVFEMDIKKNLQPGEYAHNQSSTSIFGLNYFAPANSFLLNHGTIIILSNDSMARRMKFTFEAELVNIMSSESMQITSGKCTVNY